MRISDIENIQKSLGIVRRLVSNIFKINLQSINTVPVKLFKRENCLAWKDKNTDLFLIFDINTFCMIINIKGIDEEFIKELDYPTKSFILDMERELKEYKMYIKLKK